MHPRSPSAVPFSVTTKSQWIGEMKERPVHVQDLSDGSWRKLPLSAESKHRLYLWGYKVQGPHTHAFPLLNSKQQPCGCDCCSVLLLTHNYLVIFLRQEPQPVNYASVLLVSWLSKQPLLNIESVNWFMAFSVTFADIFGIFLSHVISYCISGFMGVVLQVKPLKCHLFPIMHSLRTAKHKSFQDAQ